MLAIHSVAQLQDIVREQPRVVVRAGGTKPALSAHANIDLAPLSGIVEYDPTEYTFTARAGTKLSQIQDLLAVHHQFMAFDPVMVEAGGTIGGAIASGISGPGRFRYGGLRDFLLGVLLVNGEGDVVRGGGKVVKNAAGFDIPKLMVGSLGRFGIVTEATFKVFPRPEAYATAIVHYTSGNALNAALEDMHRVATSPAEAACLDLVPPGKLIIRVGGITAALPQRIDRIKALCTGTVEVLRGDDDSREWSAAREFTWRAPDQWLLRIPVAPRDITAFEQFLADGGAGPRRYSVGGHLLWLCWPPQATWTQLETILGQTKRQAQIVIGDHPWQESSDAENAFAQRLLKVFDPHQKFQRRTISTTTGEPVH